MSIRLIDYLDYCFTKNYVLKKQWWLEVYTQPKSDGVYVRVSGDIPMVEYNNEWVSIDGIKTLPILNDYLQLKIKKGHRVTINEDMTTTVGRYILNYLFIEWLTGDSKYINKMTNFKDIATDIFKRLSPNAKNPLSYDIIDKLGKLVYLLRPLSGFKTVSLTEKTFFKPDGLDEFRKRTYEKYVKNYGKDFTKDKTIFLMYEQELMKWIKDYYKDDPTFDITMVGKVLNSSVKKRYVSYGILNKMSPDEPDRVLITPLSEGYPKDKEMIAGVNNATRQGSAGRGIETQTTGVVAKELIKATHGFKIKLHDCGTKEGFNFRIEEPFVKVLTDLYLIEGKNTQVKYDEEWFRKRIGQTVIVRLPTTCKERPGDVLCKYCVGDTISTIEGAIGLMAINAGGDGVNNSLSKFHDTILELKDYTTDVMFRDY